MKNKLLLIIATVALVALPKINFGQVINLGSAADFVLFSTVGAVSNSGITHLTGNVGTNSGSNTGFGNVDGSMYANDGITAQCSADLLIAYNDLDAATATFFLPPLLGNGQTLIPGVYEISGASTMNLDLILDAQGNSSAVFIIRILGSFSTNANSKVKLINGALACNVYWQVEGLVSMATGTTMRGTVIANNAAIEMNSGDTLEGRAMSTAGAVTVDGILAYKPIGCGSPVLNGPLPPSLVSVECYALFSSNGPVTNTGSTFATGDIGTNSGLTTGHNPLFVSGMIHPIPDGSTAAAAVDLLNAYNLFALIPTDIELLFPAQFGNNLKLTPHKYEMNGAVTFTDTVYLDAQMNPNAVFVIHTFGAFSTSTYSKVILINGTQVENVYWIVDGAVEINDYSNFQGTIICNNGAMDINSGVTLVGRALTTNGALNTNAITVTMPIGCGTSFPGNVVIAPTNQTVCVGDSGVFTVIATGTGLTYQWRKGLVNLVNGGNISGVNTPNLTIYPVTALDAANNYNVIVSGATGPSDTSANATLTVNIAASIISGPADQMGCEGSSVSFSVITTGTGLTYQWRKGLVNLVNGGNISGADSSVLTLNPVNISDADSNYNVVVSGTCSPNATSANATLTVNPTPIVSLGPDNIIQPSPTATLNAGGGFSSYLWNTTDTTQTIIVNTNGIFIVTVTDGFGCSNSDTIQVNFTNSIINNDGSISIINLYPNPTTGPVNLNIENLVTEDLVITVIDMTGAILIYKYIGSVSGNLVQSLDFSELTNGMYIIRMTANGHLSQLRFVISK